MGETVWYLATWCEQWVAQLSLSAAALKCGVRDRWIGWDFRSQYGRLKLIANHSRFLILPDGRWPNVGSRVLSLTERRVVGDWQARFGHPLLLLETFVDPRRFHGGVYRAANWLELGLTQGYRRTREGYSEAAEAPSLCSMPTRCARCRSVSRPLTIHAAARDDAIACRWSWASRRALPCAVCAATKPSPTGPLAWGSKPARASAVGVRTDTLSYPANWSFAMAWSALLRRPWITGPQCLGSGLGCPRRYLGDGWQDDEECPRRGRATDPHHERRGT